MRLARLYAALQSALRGAIARADGLSASELKKEKKWGMQVHGRTGLACPVCADTIRQVIFTDSTFQDCPTCQTGGNPSPIGFSRGCSSSAGASDLSRSRTLHVRQAFGRIPGLQADPKCPRSLGFSAGCRAEQNALVLVVGDDPRLDVGVFVAGVRRGAA